MTQDPFNRLLEDLKEYSLEDKEYSEYCHCYECTDEDEWYNEEEDYE